MRETSFRSLRELPIHASHAVHSYGSTINSVRYTVLADTATVGIQWECGSCLHDSSRGQQGTLNDESSGVDASPGFDATRWQPCRLSIVWHAARIYGRPRRATWLYIIALHPVDRLTRRRRRHFEGPGGDSGHRRSAEGVLSPVHLPLVAFWMMPSARVGSVQGVVACIRGRIRRPDGARRSRDRINTQSPSRREDRTFARPSREGANSERPPRSRTVAAGAPATSVPVEGG